MNYLISGEATLYGYSYSYDNLSRLTKAVFLTSGNPNASKAYNMENITYDKHGNMKAMQLYGKSQSAAYGALVDNLTMTYTGNRLTRVEDAAAAVTIAGSMDFKNYSNTTAEYAYNANGAMDKDLNKGISQIQYNSLNLLRIVDIKNKSVEGRNEYTYSASGQKLKAVQKWNPNYSTSPVIGSTINTAALTMSSTTDYVGNIIYENNALKRILVDGGYYEGGNYYFYITDHLGNNRIVANAAASVVQSTQYYPFGTSFADASGASAQPYKYNGKELDVRNGLNMYDYGARWKYDWNFPTIDPHAKSYYSWSPYHYAANNPLLITDPTGMDWYRNEDGTAYAWREGDDETYTHTIGEGDNAISMTMSRIGETYVQILSDGTKMVWNQQNLESMTEPQSFEQSTMSAMEKWSSSDNFFASLGYNILNDAYVTGQGLVHLLSLGTVGRNRVNELTGGEEYANLDGTTNDKAEFSLINTASMAFSGSASKLGTTALPQGLGYVNKMGAVQFSHTFKGNLSTFSPVTRGFLNRGLNQGISTYNNQISNGMVMFKAKGLAPKKD